MEMKINFEDYTEQLQSFYGTLKNLVDDSVNMNYQQLRNLLDDFYIYGWAFEFGDGKSFYEKKGNYLKAMDSAKELNREEDLREILEKIWQILPQFYEIHQKLGDPVPQIPEKWF